MNNLFKTYDSENDERLDKKFSYNYQVIKNAYPKVSKLPEDEVREIIRKYYDATGTHEESMQAVMDYIRQKEPEWRKLYFKSEALDNGSRIQPITERQKEEAEALARQIRPEMPNMFTDDIVDNIWNKYAPYLPTYKVSKYMAVPKMALDHWQNMDNKNIIDMGKQAYNIYQDYKEYYPLRLNDKYKHAVINCRAAQRGQTGEDLVTLLSRLKEYNDVHLRKEGKNTWSESIQDSQANALGRSLGRLYKDGNCEEMVSKRIKRNY